MMADPAGEPALTRQDSYELSGPCNDGSSQQMSRQESVTVGLGTIYYLLYNADSPPLRSSIKTDQSFPFMQLHTCSETGS